jgi:hypothetical protein
MCSRRSGGGSARASFPRLAGRDGPHDTACTRSDTVAEALESEAWRERQRQHRKEARERRHRLVTVCGKWRGGRKIPDLRLMGLGLERAGFELGQHYEVEVGACTLTIRAI